MGLQKHSDHTKLFVGHGFTGCGKTRFWCHSERSEESLFDLSPMHREILRFAQNDKRTFSAASSAVPSGGWVLCGFSRWPVIARHALRPQLEVGRGTTMSLFPMFVTLQGRRALAA